MSTGLTYITFFDSNAGNNPEFTGQFIFSSYDEAMSWSEWQVRCMKQVYGYDDIWVHVYTTGHGQNGYWRSATQNFVDFD